MFIVYTPTNRGLERFNYLAQGEFVDCSVTFQRARGEEIPRLVEADGGYGLTGNDLYVNYCLSVADTMTRVVKFMAWPEEMQPRLCLLGPEEKKFERMWFSSEMRVVAPIKYQKIIERYFSLKKWEVSPVFLEGQVERQIRLGKADVAIDIVYSGKTMLEERLRIYDTVFDQSGLVLITKDI